MAGSVFEGKSFDEAVKKGLDALKLSRAEAVITTIEEGKGGFLGFGSRPFRVSVLRRPGGAIKEPAEREERSGGAARGGRDGRRGGREERGGRGGREERPVRGGRDEKSKERGERGPREERGGRGGRDAAAAPAAREDRGGRGGREERPQREDRGGRDGGRGGRDAAAAPAAREDRAGRGGRDEAAVAPREDRAPREERAPREDRALREERAPREERAAREDRAPREDRGGRERAPREERVPVQAAGPSPVPPSVSGDDDTDANGRKRRRRGRRGGRGRRRGGAEDGSDQDQLNDTPMAVNGAEPLRAAAPAEPMPVPVAMAATPPPVTPRAYEPEPVPVMRSPEPVPAPAPVAEPAYASGSQDVAPTPPREQRESREPREHREPREGRRERPRHERSAEGGEGASSAPDMSSDELAATSKRLTEELLRHMGFEPTVTARVEGNRVDVTAEVDRDDHLLTGRQGETLQSLQHLLNRFLNKGDGSRYHLQLEVNDHWAKRELELEEMAKKFADDAIAQNAEIVSDYLNSQERRIIHVTLKEDRRVRTFSLGMGMVKRVAVAPASFPERTEDDSAS